MQLAIIVTSVVLGVTIVFAAAGYLIDLKRGVCGTCASTGKMQLVPDVHAFPGHIACDAASRSEIVIPLLSGSLLLGVLDIDSPRPARFDAADAAGLGELARLFVAASASSGAPAA